MKKYHVYIPCVYSEIYLVNADTKENAIIKVEEGKGHCIGEISEGKEHLGIRAVLVKDTPPD